ncbi:MAG: hypothetical protein LBH20_07815 [Treponema sp.]|nr:hypothetical protein [Treponema sp.]
MNKLNILSIVFILALLFISCQKKNSNDQGENNIDHKKIYEILLNDKKYDELYDHLQMWETKEPENPEIYIAYFNYYIHKDRFSGVSIDMERKGDGPTLQMNDPKTGEIVGYLNDSVVYNNNDIIIAVEYLDKGLSIAPNRLDMHFGKIHILNEIKYYKEAGNELYGTLEISKIISNNWLWSNNEKIEDEESFFLNCINNYYSFWLNEQTEESLNQTKQCAEKQIELYSDNIFAYNYLALYYTVKSQLREALKCFLQAEKINPNDCIVLTNIGRIYLNINDKQKADEYFRKVLQIGSEQDKQYAQYFLNQL